MEPMTENSGSTDIDAVSNFSWGHDSVPSVDTENTVDDTAESLRSRLSSTASLGSSVYDFVEENGRTYHRYKEGKYLLPNDATEQDRLAIQHVLFFYAANFRLYLAPIEEERGRVLDFGTGTGSWAIDFALKHPEWDVLGTDLSPIQPEFVPDNCKFEIDDAEDEWMFSQPFDFIHARAMVSAFTDPGAVIRQAVAHLKPGGWMEFQDFVFPIRYKEGEAPAGCSIPEWNDRLLEAAELAGRPWTNVANYKRYFEEAGLEDVQEKIFYLPSNSWGKGKYFKVLGMMFQEDVAKGLEAATLKLYAHFLGWSVDRIQEFLVKVKKDFADPNIHAYIPISFVYGRKPSA